MSTPEGPRNGRPHKRWPITVITLILLWILIIFLLIHNGPRQPPDQPDSNPPPRESEIHTA